MASAKVVYQVVSVLQTYLIAQISLQVVKYQLEQVVLEDSILDKALLEVTSQCQVERNEKVYISKDNLDIKADGVLIYRSVSRSPIMSR